MANEQITFDKQMQAISLQEQAAEIVHGAKRKPKGGYNF